MGQFWFYYVALQGIVLRISVALWYDSFFQIVEPIVPNNERTEMKCP